MPQAARYKGRQNGRRHGLLPVPGWTVWLEIQGQRAPRRVALAPGYLLAAPSALHAVRNASILVVRNHILVLRSRCLNPSSLPCAKPLPEPVIVAVCEAVA